MKKQVLVIIIILNMIFLSACWNYREIERLSVVSGVAIDKGIDKKYLISAEIIKFETGGAETKTSSELISEEGDTIFDAVREMISLIGERLYWSHTKVVIISDEVAREGLVPIADWFVRDAETRGDINILISKSGKAKEILQQSAPLEEIVSFELSEMIKNQESVSRAPVFDVWQFVDELSSPGISPILPVVDFEWNNNEWINHIHGVAIFKQDKLISYIDEESSREILFVIDEVKGGIIAHSLEIEGKEVDLSLEILDSKTQLNPQNNNQEIKMVVKIEIEASIAELETRIDYTDDKIKNEITQSTQRYLENKIEDTIKKIQMEEGVDVFGFGNKIYKDMPDLWEVVEENWEDEFKTLEVEVLVKINIKNTALLSKPIKVGD